MFLGGDDFDLAIVDHILSIAVHNNFLVQSAADAVIDGTNTKLMHKLRRHAKQAKEGLGVQGGDRHATFKCDIEFPESSRPAGAPRDDDMQYILTTDILTMLLLPHLQKTKKLLEEITADAEQVGCASPSVVIMMGGSSRIHAFVRARTQNIRHTNMKHIQRYRDRSS